MLNEILFFFSAVGVFNTFCLSIYLLVTQKTFDYYFLIALFLLLVSIRVAVSCIYFFNLSLHPAYLEIGLISHLLSGVCFYAAISSDEQKDNKNHLFHLMLSFIVLVIFGVVVPFSEHFDLWDDKIRYIFHAILTVYIGVSWLKVYSLKKKHTSRFFQLSLLILSAFTLVCFSYAISLYTNYIYGPILYSVIFYLSIAFGYAFLRIRPKRKHKYGSRKIKNEEATPLLAKIDSYIVDKKSFKNPNLKVKDLADEIDLKPHQLSQLLNDNLGINFSTYINRFRIDEAKKLLKIEKKLTIEAIGQESGFSSKTTFFKVFKAETGLTPSAFIKSSAVLENGTNL